MSSATPILVVDAIVPPPNLVNAANLIASSVNPYSEFFRLADFRAVVVGKNGADGWGSRTLVLYGIDSGGRTYFFSAKLGKTMFSRIVYINIYAYTGAQTIIVVLGRDWLWITICSIISGLVAVILGVILMPQKR